VLVYVGTNDLACNFVGNYRTVQGLDWTGGSKFRDLELRNWEVEGHVAGETKTNGKLTWATVRGAGHLVSLTTTGHTSVVCQNILTRNHVINQVPFDKPIEAAYLVEHWLAGKEL
jgi:carboxypeptidase C (cathepsin A)